MLWLARQPGETLAERAGDTQRMLAVAREENFDTLENRVLRSYCELARNHCRDYLRRNRTGRNTRRARDVAAYGKRCGRLARDLAACSVRCAEAGVTPNFTLQQNALYRRIWQASDELLGRERVKDELWRRQAASWEEFTALALVVALIGMGGAQLIASSPLWFRDEQKRGRWIEADNPLAVIHLPGPGLIVEVQAGPRHDSLALLGASIWLRAGSLDETDGFLRRIAIWPLWSPMDGLAPGEASELHAVLNRAATQGLAGALVIRPAGRGAAGDFDSDGPVLALTLGTEGAALSDMLGMITMFIEERATGAMR